MKSLQQGSRLKQPENPQPFLPAPPPRVAILRYKPAARGTLVIWAREMLTRHSEGKWRRESSNHTLKSDRDMEQSSERANIATAQEQRSRLKAPGTWLGRGGEWDGNSKGWQPHGKPESENFSVPFSR